MSFFHCLRLRATAQYHTIIGSWQGLLPVPVFLKISIVLQKSRMNFIRTLHKYFPKMYLSKSYKLKKINIRCCSLWAAWYFDKSYNKYAKLSSSLFFPSKNDVRCGLTSHMFCWGFMFHLCFCIYIIYWCPTQFPYQMIYVF